MKKRSTTYTRDGYRQRVYMVHTESVLDTGIVKVKDYKKNV